MKALLTLILILLLNIISTYSQYEINEDMINAEIRVNQSILVKNMVNDITLSGEFVVVGLAHTVSITPLNGRAISIVPATPTHGIDGEPENKVAIDDDIKMPFFSTIYPNPANENLTIYTNTVIKTVEIYTVYGEKKITQSASGTNKEINLQFLKNGIYIVKVYLENGVILNRIITKQ